MSDYPLGAKYDKNAPYNQPIPRKEEVEVCVSVTYHKTLKVTVKEDYDNVDLNNAAQEKVWDDLKRLSDNGWYEDEFEVVEE